jgi:hypothetical protein
MAGQNHQQEPIANEQVELPVEVQSVGHEHPADTANMQAAAQEFLVEVQEESVDTANNQVPVQESPVQVQEPVQEESAGISSGQASIQVPQAQEALVQEVSVEQIVPREKTAQLPEGE